MFYIIIIILYKIYGISTIVYFFFFSKVKDKEDELKGKAEEQKTLQKKYECNK